MEDQTKKVILNHVRAIQAQCELLLWFLDEENELSKSKKEPPPFNGESGECDQFCSKDDFISLGTFAEPNKVQCKRCLKMVGEKNGDK